jgi:hypothetical protein
MLVQLGKALSVETFAEGIESDHELSMLRGEDCRQRARVPVRATARPPRRQRPSSPRHPSAELGPDQSLGAAWRMLIVVS